jgi:hypothetical protein
MASVNWKSLLRVIALKAIGILVALVLLPLAFLFISYPLIALSTTHGGKEAKIAEVSDHLGKMTTGFRIGGIFTIATQNPDEKKKPHHKPALNQKIYCLYPVWPDQLEPSKGDLIRVWPSKKPLVGAPATEGWGWFIVGTVFVLGLVLLEFTFLALTVS